MFHFFIKFYKNSVQMNLTNAVTLMSVAHENYNKTQERALCLNEILKIKSTC